MLGLKPDWQVGYRVRKAIHRTNLAIRPVVRWLLPNFRAVHYFYIIAMLLVGLWTIFPCHNLRYVDALFFMVGALTQGGLNTVDGNKVYLYQQLMIYLVTTLTTPIFIHGLLLLVRLYWFEREFDNIKEKLTLNHKMRRYHSSDSGRFHDQRLNENTVRNQGIGMAAPAAPAKLLLPMLPMLPLLLLLLAPLAPLVALALLLLGTVAADGAATTTKDPRHDVTFGALPKPPLHQRRHQPNPEDMYRLIAMLNLGDDKAADDDNNDLPLVVRPPNEVERGDGPAVLRRKLFNFPTLPLDLNFSWKRPRLTKLRKLFTSDRKPLELARTPTYDDSNADEDALIDLEVVLDDDDDLPEPTPSTATKFNTRSLGGSGGGSGGGTHGGDGTGAHLRAKAKRLWRETLAFIKDEGVMPPEPRELDSDYNPLHKLMLANYLLWNPTLGRNSQFINLTEEQKEELGGVEYRATKLLVKIVFTYYVGFHLACFFFLLGFINVRHDYGAKMRDQGISPNWWAAFTAQLLFNDLGLTITEDLMMTYSHNIYVLLILLFFIVIGNTGFPVLLRFIIWVMKKFSKKDGQLEELLGFLLDHPRRCFTLLFPLGPTWWLFFFVIILNGVDLLFFMVLDLTNPYFDDTPMGIRVVQGLFQAFLTRTAGFSCVDVASLHLAVQVLYVIMMYISVLPIAVTIRRTNVYEEQLLGLYGRQEQFDPNLENTPRHYIGQHLRNQLSFDLWFIFLGLFIICICENSKLDDNDIRFTPWLVLFEVVLAYGTVGMLLGYPDVNTSLTGKFTTLSKLVIMAMLIRGRHRGLPYTLDRAIMLPLKQMRDRDLMQELHELRRQSTLDRSNTDRLGRLGRLGRILPDGNFLTDLNFLTRIITGEGPVYGRQRPQRAPDHRGHDHRPEEILFVPGRRRVPQHDDDDDGDGDEPPATSSSPEEPHAFRPEASPSSLSGAAPPPLAPAVPRPLLPPPEPARVAVTPGYAVVDLNNEDMLIKHLRQQLGGNGGRHIVEIDDDGKLRVHRPKHGIHLHRHRHASPGRDPLALPLMLTSPGPSDALVFSDDD